MGLPGIFQFQNIETEHPSSAHKHEGVLHTNVIEICLNVIDIF